MENIKNIFNYSTDKINILKENLLNNRAWVSYDRVTGQIKVKEG